VVLTETTHAFTRIVARPRIHARELVSVAVICRAVLESAGITWR
jgi:hypothetical protein